MDRKREVGKGFKRRAVHRAGLEAPARALETPGERTVFILVTAQAQQAPDFFRAHMRLTNRLQRGIDRHFIAGHRLEKRALEFPAADRARRVDMAPVVRAQHGARLGRARDGAATAADGAKGQAGRGEPGRVITALQFDIAKEDAVAAQAAVKAQARRHGFGGHWIIWCAVMMRTRRRYREGRFEANVVQPLRLPTAGVEEYERAMPLVTIFTALNPMDAQLTRARLEAAGLHPEVTNELSALSLDGYALAAGGILVQVPAEEVADANDVLASTEPESPAP